MTVLSYPISFEFLFWVLWLIDLVQVVTYIAGYAWYYFAVYSPERSEDWLQKTLPGVTKVYMRFLYNSDGDFELKDQSQYSEKLDDRAKTELLRHYVAKMLWLSVASVLMAIFKSLVGFRVIKSRFLGLGKLQEYQRICFSLVLTEVVTFTQVLYGLK